MFINMAEPNDVPDTENDEKDIPCPLYMRNFIYHCARDGLSIVVSSQLKDMPKADAKMIIEQTVVDEYDQKMTPLMIASKNGHESTVRVLLKEFGADPNGIGSVKFDGFMVQNASALWCAAANGHLRLVKVLVKAGADVNHVTHTYSTPLRAACYDGRLDIVRYLADHGAILNLPNKYNNSCLMIAAFRGHHHVVSYLLDEGMDPNQMANCGATPLFYAAQGDHLPVVKLLIERGAQHKPTNTGVTPCLAAAESCGIQIVNYFVLEYDGLSLQEKIAAYELLGASFANDRGNHCLTKAYFYLQKAMALRYQNENNFISKPIVTPIKAYNFAVESQNMDELIKIKNKPDAIHMEGLAIRERILGSKNPEIIGHILLRGAVFADNGKYDRCLDLWYHALDLCVKNGVRVSKDLIRFIQIFNQMNRLGIEIDFSMLHEIMNIAVNELAIVKSILVKLECDIPKKEEEHSVTNEDLEYSILVALHLLALTINNLPHNSTEKDAVYALCCRLNRIKAKNKEGKTLLHLAVDPMSPDYFKTHSIISMPCPKTTKLLLDCGADVNALDNQRNTPLHLVATFKKSVRDFKTIHSVITLLINAGAHMDIVNAAGNTPLDSASTAVAEVIFQSQTKPPPLKCLSARMISKYNIDYLLEVPVSLISFIQLHGTFKKDLLEGKEA